MTINYFGARKYAQDSCPWTLSVPRSSQLPESEIISSDNYPVHISSPNVVYCLYNIVAWSEHPNISNHVL